MSEPLKRLQTFVAAYLRMHTYFDDIEIVAVRDKDTQGIIDAALAGTKKRNGKAGLAISVLMPVADAGQPVEGPRLEGRVIVRVQEIEEINNGTFGVGIAAEDVAMTVLQYLNRQHFGGELDTLLPDAEAVTPSREIEPRLTYDVRFKAPLQLLKLTRVAPVTITNAAGNITLACATSGASIYYSLDESMPDSTTGTLYSAPFATPAAGTVIFAAAYKTGLAGSRVNDLTI